MKNQGTILLTIYVVLNIFINILQIDIYYMIIPTLLFIFVSIYLYFKNKKNIDLISPKKQKYVFLFFIILTIFISLYFLTKIEN